MTFAVQHSVLRVDDFVSCYGPRGRRNKRKESERFRAFSYDELIKREKVNFDIFWLKDDGHIDPDSLPPPDEIAAEIVEKFEAALERFLDQFRWRSHEKTSCRSRINLSSPAGKGENRLH